MLLAASSSVTAAVTPKGERRRYALVSAAAELLCEGGFDAVRHRAVARRAGLPLASTTYYFSSLDDLLVHAVEYTGSAGGGPAELTAGRLGAAPPRSGSDRRCLGGLCCSVIAPARSQRSADLAVRALYRLRPAPWLRDVQRRLREQRTLRCRGDRTLRPDGAPRPDQGVGVCARRSRRRRACRRRRQPPRRRHRRAVDVIDVLAPSR